MSINIKNLFDAGVHIGHQNKRKNASSNIYIYKKLNGVSVINLNKTLICLENAKNFLRSIIKNHKEILLVGTKKKVQEIAKEISENHNIYYCINRWLGGTLTNFVTISKSIEKYKNFINMENDGKMSKISKKELSSIKRTMNRMKKNFEGILHMKKLPSVLIIIDTYYEKIAVAEAKKLNIPIIGIVDTNGDPNILEYPIPANDDSSKSVKLILEELITSIK